MINTNYWYHSCIRTYILHTLRLFQNFCISEGLDENGNNKLRRIPCVYMSTDKSVVYMLNNATDTVLQSCPKMVLALSNVKLNSNKMCGPAYFEQEVSVTEKKFNPDIGNYEYKPGNSYNITRLNPLPLGLEFKLYILTSMQDQKFQLFEQIRSIFSPTLELQTSENPLDWSRVTAITLTGLNWSSKGTENLDSSTLDSMDMTFEVDINLDMPSLVQKETIIDQVVAQIGNGDSLDDMMAWSLEDVTRSYYSPSNNRIKVMLAENGQQKLILEPSEKCKNWYELFEHYGIKYNKLKLDVNINCLTDSNIDQRTDIIGHIHLNPNTPEIADWHIDTSTLPQTNVKQINEIVDPHNCSPKTTIGTRYLIDSDISNCELWGKFINENGVELTDYEKVSEGSIIEYTENGWKVSLNPKATRGVYYVRDDSEPLKIYTYNNDYNMWVDVINKTYPVGFWRITQPIINE